MAALLARKNLIEAFIALIVRILSALVGYGAQIFLANMLAISEYGIYVTLWTWMIVANHLSVMGFSETAIRFIPRYVRRSKISWAKGFLRAGFKVVSFGSVAAASAMLSVTYLLSDIIPIEWLMPIAVMSLFLPFMAIELYLEGVARAFGWYMLTIVPPYIVRPVLIAGSVAAMWAMGYEVTAWMVLSAAGIVTAITALVQAYVIRRRLRKLYGKVDGVRIRPYWIWTSLPLAFVVTSEQVFIWSDVLILGFLVPASQVSIYFAALRSMALAQFIQYAFYLVTARNFSIANSDGNRAELQAKITESTNWTFCLTIPAVLLTLGLGYPILHAFGPEFVVGYPVMMVLGIAFILGSSVGQTVDLLTVLGYQRINLTIALGGLMTNIILSVILVPVVGIIGAAIGTATTYFLRAIFLTTIVWKNEKLWILPGGAPAVLAKRAANKHSN